MGDTRIEGIQMINPKKLYNMLNLTNIYPMLSDQNYLFLVDARLRKSYDESHIITSKYAVRDELGHYVMPYNAELECKINIVVYDSKTKSLKDNTEALQVARVLWNSGSRNEVMVLDGGYQDFSAQYPFLRTQEILLMPEEFDNIKTYPIEIIPGLLYMGNWQHGNMAYIQKDLKISGHVNCSVMQESFFSSDSESLLHIPLEDSVDSDLHGRFAEAFEFIDNKYKHDEAVLVFGKKGISRSVTIVIAFLMKKFNYTLETAYKMVEDCKRNIRPNRGFIRQLSLWEHEILGEKSTNISDPNY